MSNISVFGYSLTPALRFLAFGEVSMKIRALGRTGRPKTTARPTTWAAQFCRTSRLRLARDVVISN